MISSDYGKISVDVKAREKGLLVADTLTRHAGEGFSASGEPN
jgi:hypothetical protein